MRAAKLPVDWKVQRLGNLCAPDGSIQTGPFGSQLHAGDYEEEGIPIITVEHLDDARISHDHLPLVGVADYKRLGRYSLSAGDLVFSRVGSIDRCSFVSEREHGWLFSGRCLRVRPGKASVDSRFLLYFLNSSKSRLWILGHSVGSTMPCLNTTILAKVPVDVPPLYEQRRIAEILSTVDENIEQTEALIAKYEQIKAGLMHDLFTRGLTPDGRLRPTRVEAPHLYKQSPLGWIPKEWAYSVTGDCTTSIVPGRNKPALVPNGEFPWITIADVDGDRISQSKLGFFVNSDSLRLASGRTVPESAVITSCVGEFGIAGVTGCELVINQQLHAFVPDGALDPFWLMYCLRCQKAYLDRIATQTTIRYINKAGCESIPLPLPSRDEQTRIVAALNCEAIAEQLETARADKLRQLKAGLMQNLLTGRVRVPLPELTTA